LPEYDFVDSSSTQLGVVQVRRVNHGDSPPRARPAICIATVTRVAEPFPVNLERSDYETMTNLAVDAEDRTRHEVVSATPQINQAREVPILLDVLEGCAVGW